LVPWTSNGVEEKTMERCREIKCLKVYLQYLTLKKEYKAKQVGVSLTFKKKKNEYVLLQFHEFDEKITITIFSLHLMPYT
jgi:hypothetical protein